MLRTDVDHIVISGEESVFLRLQYTVLVEVILQSVIRLHIILEGVLIVELPVLAEGESLEVTTQEQASHVGMTEEHDAIEIIYLTLQQIGYAPDMRYGRNKRNQLTVGITRSVG